MILILFIIYLMYMLSTAGEPFDVNDKVALLNTVDLENIRQQVLMKETIPNLSIEHPAKINEMIAKDINIKKATTYDVELANPHIVNYKVKCDDRCSNYFQLPRSGHNSKERAFFREPMPDCSDGWSCGFYIKGTASEDVMYCNRCCWLESKDKFKDSEVLYDSGKCGNIDNFIVHDHRWSPDFVIGWDNVLKIIKTKTDSIIVYKSMLSHNGNIVVYKINNTNMANLAKLYVDKKLVNMALPLTGNMGSIDALMTIFSR